MILRDLNDPRIMGFPSVTRVKVSEDLANADVFFTVMGTPGQQEMVLNALKHSAGLMRMKLTKSLNLRVAPYLKFHLDEDLKKELEMMALLDRVARENAELDRQRTGESGEAQTPASDEATAENEEAASAKTEVDAKVERTGATDDSDPATERPEDQGDALR